MLSYWAISVEGHTLFWSERIGLNVDHIIWAILGGLWIVQIRVTMDLIGNVNEVLAGGKLWIFGYGI